MGDRLSDINAAKDNGLVAIGCNFDFAQSDELTQSDIVINDLIERKTLLPVNKKDDHLSPSNMLFICNTYPMFSLCIRESLKL